MTGPCDNLRSCLLFSSARLARVMNRLADEAFMPSGLSPPHAMLVMVAAQNPGIGQKDLGAGLDLAPSTITRFVDALVDRGLLRREQVGKSVAVHPTAAGTALLPEIQASQQRLHAAYSARLGDEAATQLASACAKAVDELDP